MPAPLTNRIVLDLRSWGREMQRHFNQGEFLFRQGDPSDCVLRIDAGSVEILREVGDTSIVLGNVLAGQFVGEMGVIEKRLRNATARAIAEVEAEEFTVQEFFERVSADPTMAQELILRLSVRLREIEDKIADDLPLAHAIGKHDRTAAWQAPAGPVQVQLVGETTALREQMGSVPIKVDKFPFVVGRRPRTGEKVPRLVPDLLLGDKEPFRISRQHFMIANAHEGLVVRDLGSHLGTSVNEEPIGFHFRSDSAELRSGQNRIVAGGSDSDFVFTILVG
jgi:CRP/FNR family transcriptional regulator, cyclic AMP receptor protein